MDRYRWTREDLPWILVSMYWGMYIGQGRSGLRSCPGRSSGTHALCLLQWLLRSFDPFETGQGGTGRQQQCVACCVIAGTHARYMC